MLRLLVLSILILSAPAAAQTASGPIDRGSMVVGGSANLSRSESEGQSATSISLQPVVLWFVANRIAIGGELGLGYTDHENGETTSWRVGPAARLYFGESSSKTLTYLGAALLFGSASSSSGGPLSGDSESSVWRIEGVGGVTFMISRQVGIAGELFFSRDENTFESPSTPKVTASSTNYGVRFGLSAFVF